MSERPHSQRDCERFERIVLDEAAGPIPSADEAFRDAHLAACEACRVEHAAHRELRFDGTAPAASVVDDLARRRMINDVVARARAEGRRGRAGAPGKPTSASPRRWVLVAGAMAAGLVLGLGIALWPRAAEHPTESTPPTAPRAVAAGHVLLRSGDARLGRTALQLRQPVRARQRLAVHAGRAALRLPQGSTLLVGADTELGLTDLKKERVAIRLDRGTLLASVTKRRPGQVFRVDTPAGQVTVKGTAFSLYAAHDYTVLWVLHGVVRVTEPGREPRDVRRGERVVLGRRLAASLSAGSGAAEQKRTAQVLGLLPAPGVSAASTLSVRTTPSGATVEVDGTLVGITPLAVELAPGRRRVVLRSAGHDAVQEQLVLKPGEAVKRDFELRRTPAVAHTSAARSTRPDVVTKSAPPRRTPPVAAPTPTARELLERAQRHRAARRWKGAARAYAELVRRYPTRSEGRAALVSLGILKLGPLGRSAAALKLFDRYLVLTRRGALAQEASYGRARALRLLGRTTAEISALRDFLKRFPHALQAPQARKRLRGLTTARVK